MDNSFSDVDADDLDDAEPDMEPVSRLRDVDCTLVEETIRGAWGTKLPRDPARFLVDRLNDDDFAGRIREAGGDDMLQRLRAEEGQLRKAAGPRGGGRKDLR